MDEETIGYICFGIVIIIFFFGGIGAIISGIRNRKKGAASQSWPAAPGVISNAWVQEHRDTDDEGDVTYSYTNRYEYQYQIGQQTLVGSRISYGGDKRYNSRRKAQEELMRFPINSRVRVYYDPNNQAESVLVRGTKGTLGGIITGIILLLLSCAGTCGWAYMVYTNFFQ